MPCVHAPRFPRCDLRAARLPLRPRTARDEVRAREHRGALRGARPSGASVPVDPRSPAPTARDRSRRWSKRRSARPATAPARYTSPHLVRLEERFVDRRRDVSTTAAARGRVGRRPDERRVAGGARRPRGAADLLRVHDGRSRSSCSGARARRHRGPRGRAWRPARRHQRRLARSRPRSRRSTSITRRSSATRSRRSRARRPGIIKSAASRSSAGRCPADAAAVVAEVCEARGARLVRAPRGGARSRDRADGTWRTHVGRPTPRRRAAGAREEPISATTPRLRSRCSTSSARSGVPSHGRRRCAPGSSDARWPARLERFTWRGAEVLLDAAHNPAGARALAVYLREIRVDGCHAGLRRDARQGRGRHARADPAVLCARHLHDRAESRAPRRRPTWRRSREARPRLGRPSRRWPIRPLRSTARARPAGASWRPDPSFSSAPCVIFFADSARRIAHGLHASLQPHPHQPRRARVGRRARRRARAGGPRRLQALQRAEPHRPSVDEAIDGKNDEHYDPRRHARRPRADRLRRHAVLRRSHGASSATRDGSPRSGNVLFVSDGNRIAAERMEFNTKTKTGTFYIAHGTRRCARRRTPSLFGGAGAGRVLLRRGTAQARAEDIQDRARRLHHLRPADAALGGACPGSITMTLDDYALLKNAVLKVKGVPLMYLPDLLLPDPGGRPRDRLPDSHLRLVDDPRADAQQRVLLGDRPQPRRDVLPRLVLEDRPGVWRRLPLRRRAGIVRQRADVRARRARRRRTTRLDGTATNSTGREQSYSGRRAACRSALPVDLQARANADYFSSITTQQRYQQNVYQATNRTRRFGANVTRQLGRATRSARTADRNDTFYGDDTIVQPTGRCRASRSTAASGDRHGRRSTSASPANSSRMLAQHRATTTSRQSDQRPDAARRQPDAAHPVHEVAVPHASTRSSAWRGTYWTESLDDNGVQVPESIGRQYFDFQARDHRPGVQSDLQPPNSGYAEKFKHVIEPSLDVQRTTAIDNLRPDRPARRGRLRRRQRDASRYGV